MKNCNITSSTLSKIDIIIAAAIRLRCLDLSDNCIDAPTLDFLRAHSKAKLIYEHNLQQIATQHALEQSHDQFDRVQPYQQ